jgi:diacylglycerol O-acyltransferase
MPDVLSALDETFLELEELEPGALMSIGGIMVFDSLPDGGSPTLEAVRASLSARLGDLPRYTQRLSTPRTGRWSRPCWERAVGFDIAEHVHRAALPRPGRDRELWEWTGEFFSHPLDRSKPLWEMVLLEGLAHGRWALASKIHHCLVDGVGSVGIMDVTLDPSPDPAAPGAATLVMPRQQGRLWHQAGPVVQAAEVGTSAGSSIVHGALHPRVAVERSRSLAAMLMREALAGAARTSLNQPIGQRRRFAAVRVPLADLKEIGRRLGGSVNDVALAACTTGLRRLLLERGEPVPRHGLRAMVPVNLRDESDEPERGNRVSALFVELPVAEPATQLQLRDINADMSRLKAAHAAVGPATLIDLVALAPPAVARAALARTAFSTRLFAVTITNVPGPQTTLYAFGAPLREVQPIVPLAAAHAVGIAIFSYRGRVTFGLNADARSVHDLDVLARGIEEGIEELRSAPEWRRRDSSGPSRVSR